MKAMNTNLNWKMMKRYMDRDELLKRIGLEERSATGDVFTSLGLFAVGVLVGAGLGMMFAPKRGDEMRQMLNESWRNRGRAGQEFNRQMGVESGLPPTTASGH